MWAIVSNVDLAAWSPAIISLLSAAAIYGTLSERVRNHGSKLKEHGARLDRHDRTFTHHGERITKLETKVQGKAQAAGAD